MRNVIVTAFAAVLLTACPTVEDPVVDDTNPTTPVLIESDIVGAWTSEGADLSPLFVISNVVKVDATFVDDGTYTVSSEDGTGMVIDFTGTYMLDESTSPATIILEQSTPYAATAEGIWEIEAGELTYEVVQTTPDLGFAAPTATDGFGATSGPGLSVGDNVQIFR